MSEMLLIQCGCAMASWHSEALCSHGHRGRSLDLVCAAQALVCDNAQTCTCGPLLWLQSPQALQRRYA